MMNAAKTHPGTIDSPYVNGMNMTSNQTGLVSSEFTKTKVAYNLFEPIGQRDFMCVFFSPSLTYSKGNSAFGNARLGGVYLISADTPGDIIAKIDHFMNPYYGLTAADVYGSDASTIAPQIFVWASELQMTLEAPEANKAGAVHFGMFPIGSLGTTG